MSYDIYLEKDGKCVEVDNHSEGGTYAMGGTTQAHLNVTYNYGWFYYHFLDKRKGIRWLYGKKAKDCIARLEKAVKILGTNQYEECIEGADWQDRKNYRVHYWAPTPGNAGYALNILLQWAKQHPEAVFGGD